MISYDNEILVWAAFTESMIVRLKDEKLSSRYIQIFSNFFFDIDIFNKFNLFILGNTIDLLPLNIAELIIKEILFKEHFSNEEANLKIKIGIVLNYLFSLVDEENTEEINNTIKQYLTILSEISIPETYVYERMIYQLVKAKYLKRTGQEKKGREIFNNVLNAFLTIEAYDFYEDHKDFYD